MTAGIDFAYLEEGKQQQRTDNSQWKDEHPMVQLGYALSSEEHIPNDLVRYAQRAEEVGFAFALISDHYHPWPRPAWNSPFA